MFLALMIASYSAFGPWDTYRSYGEGDGLSQTVHVGNVPVWFGEMMGWETQLESDNKYLAHLNTKIKFYEQEIRKGNSQRFSVALRDAREEKKSIIRRLRRNNN